MDLRRPARRILPPALYRVAQEAVTHPRLRDVEQQVQWTTRALARHLYGDLPDELEARELKISSQHGEDGVLLWIFSVIGTEDRRFVEFGVEDGAECNTANLSMNWGWSGLLLEADPDDAAAAARRYDGLPVTVECAMVRPDNVNELFARHGMDTFDLLSIDIDGHDYWVWEAVTSAPRVVVVEYNPSFGPERRVTIPYDDAFRYDPDFRGGMYHGASLAALVELGRRKGYSLVGCESGGANAFFVRDDCLGRLEPVASARAWRENPNRRRFGSVGQQAELIADLPVEEV